MSSDKGATNRSRTQAAVSFLPSLVDRAHPPEGGPLWMRWVRANTQVYNDFLDDIQQEIDRVRGLYCSAVETGKSIEVLAGYERALINLKRRVEQYELEDRQHVEFSQART